MMTHDADDRPIVLGGGIAGITAAVELAARGARPLLVESRPYLGGRARSFVHAATADEIDNGQHLLMGCYRSTFRLLDLLGTRHLVTIQPVLSVSFRDASGAAWALAARRWLPAPLGVLDAMMRLDGLTAADRRALIRLGLSLRRRDPPASESVAEYLERHRQRSAVRERLWDPLVIATLNMRPEDASASLFVAMMRRAFLGRGEDSRLAFARAGLSHLVAPAATFIERHGGTVMTGMPVGAITREADRWLIHPKEGAPLGTRRLVAALPERSLRPLLDNAARAQLFPAAIPPQDYAPIVSLYLWYDRALDAIPPIVAIIGTRVQWVFNRRAMDGSSNPAAPGLLACTISAAFEERVADGAVLARMIDEELRGVFMELRDAALVDALVIKEKHATFAATPDAQMRRPGTRTDLQGLYLAGDWTATGLPATIEGAAQSGFAAAAAVLGNRS